jgi:hypothetical protein
MWQLAQAAGLSDKYDPPLAYPKVKSPPPTEIPTAAPAQMPQSFVLRVQAVTTGHLWVSLRGDANAIREDLDEDQSAREFRDSLLQRG